MQPFSNALASNQRGMDGNVDQRLFEGRRCDRTGQSHGVSEVVLEIYRHPGIRVHCADRSGGYRRDLDPDPDNAARITCHVNDKSLFEYRF